MLHGMTTKLRTKRPSRTRTTLAESLTLSAGTVDREAGVIRGVKVLGLKSRNGRRYIPEAVRKGARLYEKVSVRTNHPKKANDSRNVSEVFGWLEGVEVRDDGLYADLHILNPRTELAESVMNAAESAPHLFSLSHNADGSTTTEDGIVVVHEINEVRSVDLGTDGATTGSLFESTSNQGRTMKLKQLFESVLLFRPQRRLIEQLYEDDIMDPGMDVPMDAPADPAAGGGDPQELLRQGFKAACVAVLDDGAMDMKGKLKKLKEIMAAEEKLLASDEPAEPVKEEDKDEDGDDDKEPVKEGCDDDEDKKDMKESLKLKRKNALLEAKLAVRELCDKRKVTPSSALMEALLRLPDDRSREALLDELPAGGKSSSSQKTRTQTVTEGRTTSGQATDIKSGEDFARSLRERAFMGSN